MITSRRHMHIGKYSGTLLVLGALLGTACATATEEEPNLGDDGSGGSGDGGSNSSGGTTSTGSTASTGGYAYSGGSGGSATGGAATGGAATGGAATGGAATGGAATGGAATGGAATGGAATGGAATGGSGTGGSVSGCDDGTTAGFALRYKVEFDTAADIGGQIVVNYSGQGDVPLSELEVRYYYSSEVATAGGTESTAINWSFIRDPQVNLSVTPTRTPNAGGPAGADSYVALTFPGGGNLASGKRMVFSWKVIKSGGAGSYTQSNDYSHGTNTADPENQGTATFDKIVILRNGDLVWGCAP